MRWTSGFAFFRRHAARMASAGLSVACLGASGLISPAVRPAPGSDIPVPGARLGDDGVAALPVGIRRVLADASWLLAIQHYGNRRLEGSSEFPALGALTEGALRLDPELRPAALVGALLLAEAPPLGAGEPRRAEGVLADWLRTHPGDFDAVLIRGLLRYWHLEDPEGAARLLEAASAQKDAPGWLKALAARSLTEVGARDAARTLWRGLLERADDDRARSNARTHLQQLDALDQRDQLTVAVREYERRSGRSPGGWDELVAAGLLPGQPLDPAGVPFVLDRNGVPGIAALLRWRVIPAADPCLKRIVRDVEFSVAVRPWTPLREFPERCDPPPPPRGVAALSGIAVPFLRCTDSRPGQPAGGLLVVASRSLPGLPGRYFHPLSAGRDFDRAPSRFLLWSRRSLDGRLPFQLRESAARLGADGLGADGAA